MPTVSTVADIKDMEESEIVKAFRGTVKKFLTYKENIGKKKDGSLQIIALKDKNGDEIIAKLWDREKLPASYEGREINILSKKGDRGWTGVYTEDSDYNDKNERVLRITGSAEIVRGGGGDAEDEPEDKDDRRGNRRERDNDSERDNDRESDSRERQRPERHSRDDAEAPKRGDAVVESKRRLAQMSNLYGLCYRAATYIGKTCVNEPVPMSDEHFQAATATLFIQMCRENQQDAMPVKSLFELPSAKAEESEPEGGNAEDDTQSGESGRKAGGTKSRK